MRFSLSRTSLISSVLLAGCVPKAEYDTTLHELGNARGAISKAEKALAQCQEDLANSQNASAQERSAAEQALLDELEALREANAQRQAAFDELRASLKEMIDAGDLEIYVRRGRLIIGLPSRVLFPSGKSELSKPGRRTLTKIGKALAKLGGRRIEIAGHTDNVPIGGKLEFEDNWELSTARALTVTRYLVDQGVDPKYVSAAGYGEFDPVGTNDSKPGRRKNRRIELVLVPDMSALPDLVQPKDGA